MSTSSRVLRKLGLLAAIGTAAVGQLGYNPSWAQQPAVQPAVATQPATTINSPYRPSGLTVPATVRPPAKKATANAPVDLTSAYRPNGSATPNGANRPASIGQPSEVAAKPKAVVPEVKGEAKAPIDLTSAFKPKSVMQPPQANPTVINKAPSEKTVKPEAAKPEAVVKADKPTAKPAEAKIKAPVAKPSLMQAMMVTEADKPAAKKPATVDRARRVKHCFNLLGFKGDEVCTSTAKKEVAKSPNCEECKGDSAEPMTIQVADAPELLHGPPTVQQAKQVSHMVPAQWRDAQPRPIQVAQVPGGLGNPFADDPAAPVAGNPNNTGGHFEVIEEQESVLEVRVRRSLLLRTPFDIYRTAVVDSSVCDIVQFTPREVSIVGKAAGSTNVTFWFEDGNHRPVTYVVRVIPDLEEKSRVEVQYRMLEDVISELFPDSKIKLILVADKLIVKGQAASAEEAANIMAIVRGQSNSNQANNNNRVSPVQGFATPVFSEDETGRGARSRVQVVNMLQVPGIQQVALRVKIAQLNRSAARGIGIDADARIDFGSDDDALFVQSMLNMAAGNAPSVISQFDDSNINIGLRYLQQQGVIRLLSEPTLVTLSGRPATFVSGGEFAVPTIVGSSGLNAVTTDFRAFGVIVSFVPTVLNKDRIRLQVAPEFSQINEGLNSGGTFGLTTNSVNTTVEMREGQTLAIAGLLEDTMKNTRVGNVPYLERIFGTRDTSRNENELIILVTPELVHPMEPEEVPPLPGFDVTEPTNKEFYWKGHLEGHPTSGYRSTVWPELRRRYRAGGPSMTAGQFGHGQ